MLIESAPIDTLSPDPSNARLHSPRNIDAIKASLRRFGQQKPIVVDARNIVRAGSGTLLAARALGWTHIQIVRTDLISAEATAYAIADNRTTDLSEWDDEALSAQLESLKAEGLDLSDLGFSNREARKLLDEAEEAAESLGDEQWMVVVTCKDESDQSAFLKQMEQAGRQCRALIG
jgi:ParB-like chromosome segregation protein Spo0J